MSKCRHRNKFLLSEVNTNGFIAPLLNVTFREPHINEQDVSVIDQDVNVNEQEVGNGTDGIDSMNEQSYEQSYHSTNEESHRKEILDNRRVLRNGKILSKII